MCIFLTEKSFKDFLRSSKRTRAGEGFLGVEGKRKEDWTGKAEQESLSD